MDFWAGYTGPNDTENGIDASFRYNGLGGGYYIFKDIDENNAYNSMDAGNFLWGGAMKNLGNGESISKFGAHVHNLFLGDSGTGILDSSADQRAISNGHKNISEY